MRVQKTDTEEKTLLNKVIIFVFFSHKKYSHSFIKLRSTTDVTWTIFTTFLGLERGRTLAVYAGSENSRISSKIS